MITHRQHSGNITLVAVFMTAMIAFLLLLGDNIRAMGDTTASRADVTSEQAFFASQSCLEEAYLQLRSQPDYRGDTSLQVGSALCDVTVQPLPSNPRNGQVVAIGKKDEMVRTVTSSYTDAGPTTTRNRTRIFHVLDRSGSMKEDSCSNPDVDTEASCRPPLVWGPRLEPITTAKEAAQLFNTSFMTTGYDQIGLVSYSDSATLHQGLTSDLTTINAAISNVPTPNGGTNIGAAIQLADTHLPDDGQGVRAMIVLTDGVPNSASCNRACIINRAAVAKRDHHVIIFTIGLGQVLDRDLLDTIASTNATTGQPLSYYSASRDDLAEIYAAIMEQITTFNLGQGSWYEQ